MLIHDNGRVCVMVNTRCGHTSTNHYFGLTPYVHSYGIELWYNTSSHRTMVLRNPLDRMLSAQRLNTRRFELNRSQAMSEREFMDRHCAPYLYSLAWHWKSWSYIPFEHLDNYIPRQASEHRTNSVYDPNLPVPEHLEQEMAAYEFIKTTMPILTPEQWRELTG